MSCVADKSSDDVLFDRIAGHEWKSGVLMFQVAWKTDEYSWLPFSIVKRDFPLETAA